jgi:antitoxin CptB
MTDDDARLKKLKLRAWRRGFREADLILGPFADKHVSDFSEAELDWFEALLNQPRPGRVRLDPGADRAAAAL